MAVYFRLSRSSTTVSRWVTSDDNMSLEMSSFALLHSSLLAPQDCCGCGDRSKTKNLFTRTTSAVLHGPCSTARVPRDLVRRRPYNPMLFISVGDANRHLVAWVVRARKDDPQGDSVRSQPHRTTDGCDSQPSVVRCDTRVNIVSLGKMKNGNSRRCSKDDRRIWSWRVLGLFCRRVGGVIIGFFCRRICWSWRE